MTRNALLLTVFVLGLAGCHKAEAEKEVEATAQISVATVRTQAVNQVISLFGVVEADPAAGFTVVAPRAVTVTRVLVRSGQSVSAGQPLIELAGSPESEMAFRQASDAVTFAQTDLARVQRLFADKLADTGQVAAARKTLADAEAALAAQQRTRGQAATQTLNAARAGIVTKLSANPGDHVGPDAVLISLAGTDGLVAQLGLQPGERRIMAGQTVTLIPAAGGAPLLSRISLVAKAPNPDSKLITAAAAVTGLPVGAAVQGDIVIGSHPALTIPRAALVSDESGAHVFTISGGKAHRVFVKVGADQGDDVEVSGPIHAGDSVAVIGAYELQDGMAVKIGQPAPAKASDE